MSNYVDKALQLQRDETRHYNCAQTVLTAFAGKVGLDEETAYRVAAGFGAGMKTGHVCGAITGGVMVLGLLGLEQPQNVERIFQTVRRCSDGREDCRDLLAWNANKGGDRGAFCHNLVIEVIRTIEEIMETEGNR